jgi:hypothetical protein
VDHFLGESGWLVGGKPADPNAATTDWHRISAVNFAIGSILGGAWNAAILYRSTSMIAPEVDSIAQWGGNLDDVSKKQASVSIW